MFTFYIPFKLVCAFLIKLPVIPTVETRVVVDISLLFEQETLFRLLIKFKVDHVVAN